MPIENLRNRNVILGLSALFACSLAYTACGGGSGGDAGDSGITGGTGGSGASGGSSTGGTGGTGGGTGGAADGGTAGQGGDGGASPVGVILFRSNEGGNHIWSMDEDGGNRQQLTTTASNGTPRLSPDGTRIAFERNIDSNIDVWLMDVDGSNQVNLTEGVTVNDGQASWASDGSRIAFVSRRGPDNPSNRLALFTMLTDGSDVQRLFLDGDFSVQHPYWRGDKIAFSYGPEGKWDIWLKNASDDEAGEALTADRPGDHTWPVISPDGTKILFVGVESEEEDGETEIFIMDIDGKNVEQLTENDEDDDFPCFSPDGSQILFASRLTGSWDIWRMDLDGSNKTNLTSDLDESDEVHPYWGQL